MDGAPVLIRVRFMRKRELQESRILERMEYPLLNVLHEGHVSS